MWELGSGDMGHAACWGQNRPFPPVLHCAAVVGFCHIRIGVTGFQDSSGAPYVSPHPGTQLWRKVAALSLGYSLPCGHRQQCCWPEGGPWTTLQCRVNVQPRASDVTVLFPSHSPRAVRHDNLSEEKEATLRGSMEPGKVSQNFFLLEIESARP